MWAWLVTLIISPHKRPNLRMRSILHNATIHKTLLSIASISFSSISLAVPSCPTFLSASTRVLHVGFPLILITKSRLPPQPGSHHIVRVLGHLMQFVVRQSQSSSHCTNAILFYILQVLGDFEMV